MTDTTPDGDHQPDKMLGVKLEELRKQRGLTLQQVADESGLSKSFVSQVESATSRPSIASLKRIGDALGTTLAELFMELETASTSATSGNGLGATDAVSDVMIVRAAHRKKLSWPGRVADAALLTPDVQRKLEILLTTEEPGSASNEVGHYAHEGEEFGFVIEGQFEVTVAGKAHHLDVGDSIYFTSSFPHSTRAVGGKPATTLWVITPPTF